MYSSPQVDFIILMGHSGCTRANFVFNFLVSVSKTFEECRVNYRRDIRQISTYLAVFLQITFNSQVENKIDHSITDRLEVKEMDPR